MKNNGAVRFLVCWLFVQDLVDLDALYVASMIYLIYS